MKLKTITSAALVLAGLAGFAASANAQTVSTSSGDIILAVYQTNPSGTGYGKTYEVDLGNISTFDFSGTNIDLSSRVSSSAISTIFGGTSGLDFDVVATAGSGTATVGGQSIFHDADFFTDTSAPTATSYSSLSGGATQIGDLLGELNGATVFSGSDAFAAEITENNNGEPNFKTGNGVNGEWNLPSGVVTENGYSSTAADFYYLDPKSNPPANSGTAGSEALLGSFEFEDGKFYYNFQQTQNVPEPSTYALMGAGMLALFWMARRRMASNS